MYGQMDAQVGAGRWRIQRWRFVGVVKQGEVGCQREEAADDGVGWGELTDCGQLFTAQPIGEEEYAMSQIRVI